MPSLQLNEARARFDLLTMISYDVSLDLAADRHTFPSRTSIRFVSDAGTTFLDLKPVRLRAVRLDGRDLSPERLDDGRYPLDLDVGEHELMVEALMPFRNDGEGLHRSTDPADGRDYAYGMCFMDAAPTVFACFDQPDLKAPYTLHVRAPEEWVVLGNAAGRQVESGRWEFEESRPLATYFVTVVAGPWHIVSDEHDGIPLRLTARQSLAKTLDVDADELFTITKQCFDEMHRLFGIRYPFGKYDQAFVPEFNAGAMENPGCVTFRDSLLFSSAVTRSERLGRATTVAHEMAHQWFGNLVTPRWWDDLWLNESFAEYVGNRVTAEVTEYSDALLYRSLTRKNWGLVADSRPTSHPVAGNGATNALAALQDFDGISYTKGESVLAQLARLVGDEVFLGGARDHFERHRFGNATMADLFASWGGAGAGDLADWATAWLRTAGADRLSIDRDSHELVRTPPAGEHVDRSHALSLATWNGSAWTVTPVITSGDRTPISVTDEPAVVDPYDVTWAELVFDEMTAAALPGLVPGMDDARMRASVWITLRNGVHQAALDPARALDILCAGLPTETEDAAVAVLAAWGCEHLLAVVKEPEVARERLHEAFIARCQSSDPRSSLRLAAVQGVIATCTSVEVLRGFLDGGGLPAGTELDRDLRWRVLKRLTQLAGADRTLLDEQLAGEPSALSEVDHAWCRAAIGDEAAKAWAWERFTGAVDANNYVVAAVGAAMWQPDQMVLL
nr:aminopeptidase N [Actinomycetota bacterium]